MVCLLFHQASSEARSDEAAMKSRRLRALFSQVRGTRILGSRYGEGTKAHALERGMPRGMRMMKVDPSPGVLHASMLPP